jgi:hypothetical protein
MASSSSSTIPLTYGLTGSSNMSLGSKKFIGAVEDEWQLYRYRISDIYDIHDTLIRFFQ